MQVLPDSKIFHALIRGMEKENLRVTHSGKISTEFHSAALGHPLTHSYITTDYAESQLEIMSAPTNSIQALFAELKTIYEFVYHEINDETLWPNSMPPSVESADKIQIARYGTSPRGQLKELYRKGLSHRYGSIMQLISGIHYNVSLENDYFVKLHQESAATSSLREFIDDNYFVLITNYLRHAWLLPYLFGASPMCAKSSVFKSVDYIKIHPKNYAYAPYATSLRVSDLGYQNKARHLLHISFLNLSSYINSLQQAITIKHPEFTKIGIYDAAGQKQQINDHLLQIENELYAPIRPKQILQKDEHPTTALKNRGIQYIEIRALDLNPLLPFGLTENDAAFIELLLLFFLFKPSKPIAEAEYLEVLDNINLVATRGRDPDLKLFVDKSTIKLTELTKKIFAEMETFIFGMKLPPLYESAFKAQYEKLTRVELLPSQQCSDRIEESGLDFTEFNLQLAAQHKSFFRDWSAAEASRHKASSKKSWDDLREIEQQVQ